MATQRAGAIVAGLWLLLRAGLAKKCPKLNPGFKSQSVPGATKIPVRIKNILSVDVEVVWVNFQGEEVRQDTHIGPGDETEIMSYAGHAFRIFADNAERTHVQQISVAASESRYLVRPCGPFGNPPDVTSAEVKAEMESLVHDQHRPCDPPGKSSLWSCIRKIEKDKYVLRPSDGKLYGFASEREAQGRGVGTMWDYGYTHHMKQVPRVANTSGFLKMSFSDTLRKILEPFWESHGVGKAHDSVTQHEPIAGGYTNSHVVKMSKLDLDRFRHIQNAVRTELKRYLEWWTGKRLHHTSTFGIRIYHRDAMLIDHVDRADTHIASAVIQVAQDVDEDGGWPLEVIDEDNNCWEVYLQHSELVLYEGGRFRHGRPMRLKGTWFANIFSHFSPEGWHGPGKSPDYDGHLDEHGWLLPEAEEVQRHLEI